MLPASDLSEIITNLAALNLQPNTTAQIPAAVPAPLLRPCSYLGRHGLHISAPTPTGHCGRSRKLGLTTGRRRALELIAAFP